MNARAGQPDNVDEDAVRAVEAAYDRAWGEADLDGLLECLAPDAVLVNPRGEVARGEAEIRSALGTFLFGEARSSKHRSVVTRVSFVTDEVAVVDGVAEVSLLTDERGRTSTLTHGFTDVLVRIGGKWTIAHVRAHYMPAGQNGVGSAGDR